MAALENLWEVRWGFGEGTKTERIADCLPCRAGGEQRGSSGKQQTWLPVPNVKQNLILGVGLLVLCLINASLLNANTCLSA